MKKLVLFLKVLIVIIVFSITIATGTIIYYKSGEDISLFGKNLLKNNTISSSKNVKSNNQRNANISKKGDLIVELPGDNVHTFYEINDWRLVLVNHENTIPEGFQVELAKLDGTREFDARAINELLQMIKDMKAQGVSNIWVQSAYRSPEYQDQLFNNKVNEYMSFGLSKEEAEIQAQKWVNKSETSEHNLGLAVDFNYVNKEFENQKEFKWLMENAENYGFILRYREDKEEITKVDYEPWHWRYVGQEHAKEINDLDMCLEEYIEHLRKIR